MSDDWVPPPPEPNFNDHHPELKDGEGWVLNIKIGDKSAVNELHLDTAREGLIAYGKNGQRIFGYHPVFAQLEEVKTRDGF
jgi:hypothetical protein